jgi:hypothetical protein
MRRFNRGFIMNEKTEKLYQIPYKETVFGYIKVLANSKEEALRLVSEGDYSHLEEVDSEDFEISDEDIEELD